MNTFFILLIFLVGILFRLLKSKQRHLVLRFSHHGRVQLLIRKKVVQIDITDHRRFQEIHILMGTVRIISHKHMPRRTHQNRIDIDGTKQRSEQHAAIHTVYLRRFQSIIERTYPL